MYESDANKKKLNSNYQTTNTFGPLALKIKAFAKHGHGRLYLTKKKA
jgi:hypothetical protein